MDILGAPSELVPATLPLRALRISKTGSLSTHQLYEESYLQKISPLTQITKSEATVIRRKLPCLSVY